MSFHNVITRGDAWLLIPSEVVNQVIRPTNEDSAVMRLARGAVMSTSDQAQPVVASLPNGYWVNSDTGLKNLTHADWSGIVLHAAEAATIVVVPDNVLADSSMDIWGELMPRIPEAFAVKLDSARRRKWRQPCSGSSNMNLRATSFLGTLGVGVSGFGQKMSSGPIIRAAKMTRSCVLQRSTLPRCTGTTTRRSSASRPDRESGRSVLGSG